MGQLRIEYGAYGAARGILGGQVAAFEADPGGAVTLSVTATPTDPGVQPVIAGATGPDSLFVSLTALDVPIYVDIAATPDPTTEPRWLVMPGRPLQVHAGAGSRIAAMLAADVAAANAAPVAVANGSDVAQGSTGDAAYAGSGSATLVGLLKGLYTALIAPTPAGTNNIGIVTPLDGTLPGGTSGYSSSAVATFFTQTMDGYPSISVHVTAVAASSTIAFEVSDDGANWVAKAGVASSSTGVAVDATNATSVGLLQFSVSEKYFRVRQSVYGGSGGSTVVPVLKTTQPAPRSIYVGGAAPIVPATSASATGALATTARLVSAAASTNATLVKATAGRPYRITAFNASASMKYLKIYNKSTAPTVGTDNPVRTIPLVAGQITTVDWPTFGLYLGSGIGYALTGAVADADTTALAAADVTCLHIDYV